MLTGVFRLDEVGEISVEEGDDDLGSRGGDVALRSRCRSTARMIMSMVARGGDLVVDLGVDEDVDLVDREGVGGGLVRSGRRHRRWNGGKLEARASSIKVG